MEPCWLCEDPEVVYTDSLGLTWCEKHYREFYGGDE